MLITLRAEVIVDVRNFFFFSDFPHSGSGGISKKKKKLADKILPQKVRDLVPESQAYMDLLAFERKLDSTIMRKRLDIQVRIAGYPVQCLYGYLK
jgi:hypothetical protein